jgi:predicted permease
MHWWQLKQRGADLERELQSDLEAEEEEQRERGLSREEARHAALRAFGNPTRIYEQTREIWSWSWLESLARDLRYSLRTLRRTPGFTSIAIVVMALGIGASVALFAVVRSVLLKPLPYRDPANLVSLYEDDLRPGHPQWSPYLPVDAGSVNEWQNAAQGMAQMAMLSPWQQYNVSAEGGELPEKIDAAWCSWHFFPLLGVEPALGRVFSAMDDRHGATATVVLSYSFWKRRYSGDPAIIGRSIWLNSRPYTVIGVLPREFAYSAKMVGTRIQAWTPLLREAPPLLLTNYEDHEFLVAARLMNGTRLPVLMDRLRAIQKQIVAAHPMPAVHDSVAGMPMLDDAVWGYKIPLYVLLAATGCMLLVACINVAGLLIARTAARAREQVIRAALGGGRLRLVRERLIESTILSVSAGVLGLALAWGGLRWLVQARQDMPRVESIHIDSVVLCFAAGAIALCTLFAGLIAAASSARICVLSLLHESSRTQAGGQSKAGFRRSLLLVQVSLTVVLLVGAGLLLKSYEHLRGIDFGVPMDNVLTMRVSLPAAQYSKPEQWVAFFEDLITRVRTLPGVNAAGLVSTAPGEGWGGDDLMRVVEHGGASQQGTDMMIRGADPGYFSAIGIPLLRGRIFRTDERLQRANVAVISQAAAKVFFPHEDPIGRHLDDFSGQVVEVVGVVGDTRWYPAVLPQPTLYWPIYGNNYSVATIVLRSTRNVTSLALPVEKIVAGLDPNLPVSDVMTLRESLRRTNVGAEFDTVLVLAIACIALLLAAVGLYGVQAYLVSQRTSEIGIRIALGAPRRGLLGLILAGGLWPALGGVAVGLAVSGAVVRLIGSMLYETQPIDPAVFVAVAGLLLMVAALACLAPAWRASRIDPMQALRTE